VIDELRIVNENPKDSRYFMAEGCFAVRVEAEKMNTYSWKSSLSAVTRTGLTIPESPSNSNQK
jgi:hypothetical protein